MTTAAARSIWFQALRDAQERDDWEVIDPDDFIAYEQAPDDAHKPVLGKSFNPDEPRDEHGRWTSVNGEPIVGLPAGIKFAKDSRAALWASTHRYDVTAEAKNNSFASDQGYSLTYAPKLTPDIKLATPEKPSDEVNYYDQRLGTPGEALTPWSAPRIDPQEGALGYSTTLPLQQEDGVLYRGISQEEWDAIKATGTIKSNGSGNFLAAEGTAFTTLPDRAAVYAGGFATVENKPTFAKPGYVIAVKLPPDTPMVDAKALLGVQDDERQTRDPVSASYITTAVEARPYAIRPGSMEILSGRDSTGRQAAEHPDRYFDGSGGHPSTLVMYKRVPFVHVKAFNPDQPRDEHGRWTSGGTSGAISDPKESHDENEEQTRTLGAISVAEEMANGRPLPIPENPTYGHMDLAEAKDADTLAQRVQAISGRDLGDTGGLFVSGWNYSSTNERSLALAEAAKELWKLPSTPGHERMMQNAVRQMTDPSPKAIEDAKVFLAANYDATQKVLEKMGYGPNDEIDLYRGFARAEPVPEYGNGSWVDARVSSRPLASWTSSPLTAMGFGSQHTNGYIAHSRVQRTDIVAMPGVGLGVPLEHEYVAIGRERPARVFNTNVFGSADNFWSKAFNPDQPRDDRGRWVASGPLQPPTHEEADAATLAFHDHARTALPELGLSPGSSLLDAAVELSKKDSEATVRNGIILDAAITNKLAGEGVDYVEDWNDSSQYTRAIAMVEATRQKFGLPSSSVHDARMADSITRSAEGNTDTERRAWFQAHKVDPARQFIDAQYSRTQQVFSSLGYKPDDMLDLYRGYVATGDTSPADQTWKDAQVTGRALSSWTSSPDVAFNAAAQWNKPMSRAVIHARVPVSDVMSTGFTGLGTMYEQEYTVVGRPRPAQIYRLSTTSNDNQGFYRTAKAFNPDEPRDDHGRWTREGGGPDELGQKPPNNPRLLTAPDEKAVLDYGKHIIDSLYPNDPNAPKVPEYHEVTLALKQEVPAIAKAAGITEAQVEDFQYGWKYDPDKPETVALVQAATEKWGLSNNAMHEARLAKLKGMFDAATSKWDLPGSTNSQVPYESYDSLMGLAHRYLDAQYDHTQQWFADHGYKQDDAITLYRGFARDDPLPGIEDKWVPSQLDGRAVTSWAQDATKANDFSTMTRADNGYVAAAQVRVRDILGTGYTGLGQGSEREFVVLNGKRPAWIRKGWET